MVRRYARPPLEAHIDVNSVILVAATIASWSGLDAANPDAHSCSRIPLPASALEPIAFAGDRLA